MREYRVKDMMVLAKDYASISIDASIRDGIFALEQAQRRELHEDPTRHRDRAVLVLDQRGEIIGKLSMWSIIGCLEPSYDRPESSSGSSKSVARIGSARAVINEMMESSHLWRSCLGSIADEATHLKVKDLLHAPREKELIDEDAPLEKAIHQLVNKHYMSLLVNREDRIVGVLRLVDVFEAVCGMIKRENKQTNTKHRASTEE